MNIFFAAMETPNKKLSKNVDLFFDQEYFERTGERINVLLSYYYLGDDVEGEILKHKKYSNKIIIDSGAYSIFGKYNEVNDLRAKFRVTLEYSREFLEENVFFVCSMDFREDIEGFQDNYNEYMDLKDVYPNIVPVIHNIYSEPNDEISAYSYFNPPVISIGKINRKKSMYNRDALINSINKIKQTSNCHLLAITDYNTIKSLPEFDSYDSRSWLQYSYYGYIFINYVDDSNKYIERLLYFNEKFSNIDFDKNVKEIPFSVFLAEIKDKLMISRDNLFSAEREYYRKICNIYYFIKMEKYINEHIFKN